MLVYFLTGHYTQGAMDELHRIIERELRRQLLQSVTAPRGSEERYAAASVAGTLREILEKLKMTRGEYRVGTDFNPSGNRLVTDIKRTAARLIDMIDAISVPSTEGEAPGRIALANEVARCKALAMTECEAAAMWAVKAATKQEPKEG